MWKGFENEVFTVVIRAYPKCQVQVATNDMQPFMLRTLYDTGSQVNVITASAVRRLNLPIQTSQTKLVACRKVTTKISWFRFHSSAVPGRTEPYFENFYVVGRVTCRLPFQHISLENYPEFQNLKYADPNFFIPIEIDAFMGIGL